MGIIAYCPSGHRMKVKDHLAGRTGICPTCGARFRIPRALAPAVPHSRDPGLPAANPGSAVATAEGMGSGMAPSAGAPTTATVVSLEPAAAAGLPEVLMFAAPGAVQSVDEPPLVDPDPTADLAVEPVDDEHGRADLFWYVALPGGHPSAAMQEPDMLDWLGSAQATGREVVWRSDWPGWKPIGEAFPERFPPAFPGAGGR